MAPEEQLLKITLYFRNQYKITLYQYYYVRLCLVLIVYGQLAYLFHAVLLLMYLHLGKDWSISPDLPFMAYIF